MIVKRGEGDFDKIYRPCKISEVIGNEEAKKIIETAFTKNKIPHVFLFHGLSGTGKTTLARIIEMGLNCETGPTSEPCCECSYCKRIMNRKGTLAVLELNAVEKSKDELKTILQEFDAYGFGKFEGCKKSILLIDECHGLTEGQAELFLKYAEDVHDDNYFIFCTTNPDRFLKTLRNRCKIKLPFEEVEDQEILKMLLDICQQENLNYDAEALKKIVNASSGMPRNAVNGLQQASLSGNLAKKPIHESKSVKNVHEDAAHDADGEANEDCMGDPAQAPGKVKEDTNNTKDIEDRSMGQIVPAEKLKAKIRTSNDLGQLKDIKDKAEALRAYVRKAEKGFMKQNQYAEVKIRAERRCGEILAAWVQHGGDQKTESRFNRKTLKDLGISKNQSHRWQTIAQLTEEKFEGHLAKIKESNEELTSAGVYRMANEYRRAMKAEVKPVPGAETIKTPISIKTITGDFMDQIDKFNNVDAIITDPPYPKEYLPQYENLARFASKKIGVASLKLTNQ